MNINFQTKNMESTPAIYDYVVKRVTNLGKLLSKLEEGNNEAVIRFDVSKITNHHKSGVVFSADCSININGKNFYSSVSKEDLYEAIDAVKENLFGEISKSKDKKNTLFHRGARKIKETIKGIKNWRK